MENKISKKHLIAGIFCAVSSIIVFIGIMLGLFQGGKFNAELLKMFTYESNIIVCAMFVYLSVLFLTNKNHKIRPMLVGAALLTIIITGIVYNCILVPFTDAKFCSDYINFSVHILTPILFAVYYCIFELKGNFKFSNLGLWVVYPLSYWIISELCKWYPYFFMDIPTIGLGKAFMWLFVLIAAFVVLGLFIIVFDNYVGKKIWQKVRAQDTLVAVLPELALSKDIDLGESNVDVAPVEKVEDEKTGFQPLKIDDTAVEPLKIDKAVVEIKTTTQAKKVSTKSTKDTASSKAGQTKTINKLASTSAASSKTTKLKSTVKETAELETKKVAPVSSVKKPPAKTEVKKPTTVSKTGVEKVATVAKKPVTKKTESVEKK